MTDTATEVKQDVIFKGALAGTPEGMYVSQLCVGGRHEGFVQSGACKGAFGWAGKTHYCRCACHCYIREVPPGTDFEPPPPPERDPLKPTLAEELRAWGRRNEEAIGLYRPTERPTERVTDDTITDSGRRARGALELQVLRIAQEYEAGNIEFDDNEDPWLTPQTISDLIKDTYGVAAPSTGAIRNILVKWGEMSFAVVKEHPLRLVLITPLGKEMGHEQLRGRLQK